MKNIEERAPRFMYEDNNSSYENKSSLPSLKIRRFKKNIGIETFKIIQKNSPNIFMTNIKLQNYNFRSHETAVLHTSQNYRVWPEILSL